MEVAVVLAVSESMKGQVSNYGTMTHSTKVGHFRGILPSISVGVILKKLKVSHQKQTTEE